MTDILNFVADWLLIVAFPAIPIFVLLYMRSQWRRTLPGRALMFMTMSLLGVFVLVLARTVFGDEYLFRPYLRIAIYGILLVAQWGMVVTLFRVQRSGDDIEHFRNPKSERGSTRVHEPE